MTLHTVPDRGRLGLAVLVSLLIHALVLSLSFGGDGLGLPGFELPWRDRRGEASAVQVVIVPPRSAAAESAEVPLAAAPSKADAVTTKGTGAASPAPVTPPVAEGIAVEEAGVEAAPMAAQAPPPAELPPPIPETPAVIALERSDAPTWVVPLASTVPMLKPLIAAAAAAASTADADRQQQARAAAQARERAVEAAKVEAAKVEADRIERSTQAARRQAEQLTTATIEAAQVEAERTEASRRAAVQEAARVEAERAATARREAARLETERVEAEQRAAARQVAEVAAQEAARQEVAKVDAARQEAARQEAERQQAARQEAARAETAREEAERQRVARQDAARAEAARAEAARAESVRAQTARDDLERREASRRALGRQLDEEAESRDAAAKAATAPTASPTDPGARLPSTLPYSLSGARRGRLFGRTDANAELVLYAEAWARKIQLNMSIEKIREIAKRPHTDPLVTVAIRRNGTVESVTFVLSSGAADIDEAIRQIVQSQAPYSAFSPVLAREYDVIEIRRTWYFDSAVRVY